MNIQVAAIHDIDAQGNKVTPITLPDISAQFVSLANRWYRESGEINLNLGGKAVSIQPEFNNQIEYSYSDPFFVIRCFGAEVGVRLDRKLIDALMKSHAGDIDFDTLGKEDRLLFLEFLLNPLLEQFERTFSTPVEFAPHEGAFDRDVESKLSLSIRFGQDDSSYFCDLIIGDTYLEFWCDFLNAQHKAERTHDPEVEALLEVTATLNYQSVEFTVGSLQDLDADDIILLGPADTKYLELWASGVCLWQARSGGETGSVQIIGAQNGITRRMGATQFGEDHIMNENKDINDVAVPVSFEVGRKDITIKDLKELTEGSIVSFPHDSEKDVHIVVNGKEIGWGKLVQVGDAVGVKIVRILSNG